VSADPDEMVARLKAQRDSVEQRMHRVRKDLGEARKNKADAITLEDLEKRVQELEQNFKEADLEYRQAKDLAERGKP
jgi:hypothetical protein